jgi:UbiA prenyltransferase family
MRIWLMAARPRTLPAAIAPVLVGTAAAVEWAGHLPRLGAFIAALIGSIFIQIGTNLANDYSDAKRGADTADRLGPVRVTSAGLVAPQRVLTATWIAFAVAIACGIYLAAVAGIVILLIGAVSIAARAPTATPDWERFSSSSSSASSRSTAPTTYRSSIWTPCRSASRSRSASLPPRSSSSTTSATWKPIAGRAR